MNSIISNILSHLKEVFSPQVIEKIVADSVTGIIVGAVIMLAFYLLWIISRFFMGFLLKKSSLNEMSSTFLLTLAKYSLLIIGVVVALDSMGVKVAALLASLGIAGLTIGFAARDSLSNVIAGVLIFLDRPFSIGDLVEIENFYGRVDRITLRSTRIITSDGKMLAVPNTEIINKTVASYTNFPNLRLDIPVSIAVDEDIETARQVMLGVFEGREEFLKDPPPQVVVNSLNDYNITVELRAWLKEERDHIARRFELREIVFLALKDAGVSMPYETISITPLEINNLEKPMIT